MESCRKSRYMPGTAQHGKKRKRGTENQPAKQASNASRPAQLPVSRSLTNVMTQEVLGLITKHFDTSTRHQSGVLRDYMRTEQNADLCNIMKVSKSMYFAALIPLYRHIEARAGSLYPSSYHNSVELIVRSMLKNPSLPLLVQVLSLRIGEGWAERQHPDICEPEQFFDAQDWERCAQRVRELCKLPIWERHPGGRWWWDHMETPESHNATPRAPEVAAQDWMAALKQGRTDAWFGLLLAMCKNVKELYFDEFSTLYNKKAAVFDEDITWVNRVLRGGLNSQRMDEANRDREVSHCTSVNRDFGGILKSLHTVALTNNWSAPVDSPYLPLETIWPCLALPKMRSLQMSLNDYSLPSPIFSLCSDDDIAFRLKTLDLTNARICTESLVKIIKACRSLDSYYHVHQIQDEWEDTKYNHIAEIDALAETVGHRLRDLFLDIVDNTDHTAKNVPLQDSMWAAHFDSLAEVKVESWDRFKVLRNHHVPVQYLLGWKDTDEDFFSQMNNPAGFNAYNVDVDYIEMEIPLVDQFSPTLETFEMSINAYHPRYNQAITELKGVLEQATPAGKLPNLIHILIGNDQGEKWHEDETILIDPMMAEFIELVDEKGLSVLTYDEKEWYLPRGIAGFNDGPAFTRGKRALRWTLVPEDDTPIYIHDGECGSDVYARRVPLAIVDGEFIDNSNNTAMKALNGEDQGEVIVPDDQIEYGWKEWDEEEKRGILAARHVHESKLNEDVAAAPPASPRPHDDLNPPAAVVEDEEMIDAPQMQDFDINMHDENLEGIQASRPGRIHDIAMLFDELFGDEDEIDALEEQAHGMSIDDEDVARPPTEGFPHTTDSAVLGAIPSMPARKTNLVAILAAREAATEATKNARAERFARREALKEEESEAEE